jgi:hypothetical protein
VPKTTKDMSSAMDVAEKQIRELIEMVDQELSHKTIEAFRTSMLAHGVPYARAADYAGSVLHSRKVLLENLTGLLRSTGSVRHCVAAGENRTSLEPRGPLPLVIV